MKKFIQSGLFLILLLLILTHSTLAQTSWSGRWETKWQYAGAGPPKVTIVTLTQRGNGVSGRYPYMRGIIHARAEGNILRGTWRQTEGYWKSKGKFEWIMSDDGNSFYGKYWYEDGHMSYAWNGRRIR